MTVVNQIELQDADGNTISPVIKGDVVLRGEQGLSIAPSDGGVEISVSSESDSFFRKKFEDLTRPGGGSEPGEYSFSGPPYYLASVNRSNPLEGLLFLLGGACDQIGEFSQDSPSEPWGAHGLPVYDMCLADVDCADYEDFYNLLNELRDFINDHKRYVESPAQSDPHDGYGVYDQYIALVDYWNYLVILNLFKVWYDGQFLNIMTRNSGSDVDDAKVTVTLSKTSDGSPVDPGSSSVSFVPKTHASTYTVNSGSGVFTLELTSKFKTNTELTLGLDMSTIGLGGTSITYVVVWENVHSGPFTKTGVFVI